MAIVYSRTEYDLTLEECTLAYLSLTEDWQRRGYEDSRISALSYACGVLDSLSDNPVEIERMILARVGYDFSRLYSIHYAKYTIRQTHLMPVRLAWLDYASGYRSFGSWKES